jgi:hypothetical protein
LAHSLREFGEVLPGGGSVGLVEAQRPLPDRQGTLEKGPGSLRRRLLTAGTLVPASSAMIVTDTSSM